MQFFFNFHLLRRLSFDLTHASGYTVNADFFLVLQERTGQRNVLPQPDVVC